MGILNRSTVTVTAPDLSDQAALERAGKKEQLKVDKPKLTYQPELTTSTAERVGFLRRSWILSNNPKYLGRNLS